MSYGCMIAAVYALSQGRADHAAVWALLALTFAVLRLRPGWLGRMWQDSLQREQRAADVTLFEGRRDDG